ncbi:hypothetical protein N9955_00100 [bacterium]|nr:hypothetical protein [bacterium]
MNKQTVKAKIPFSFEIEEEDEKRITLGYIYKKFNWGPNHYIRMGHVYTENHYYTTHSWSVPERIRKSTETDFVVSEMVAKIKEAL